MKLFILSVLLLTSHSYAFEAFEIKPTHSSEAHMYQKAILIDSDGIESEVQVKTFWFTHTLWTNRTRSIKI
jgi:hypothetical protein